MYADHDVVRKLGVVARLTRRMQTSYSAARKAEILLLMDVLCGLPSTPPR